MSYKPEEQGMRVAVFGATGSVGLDLIESLATSPLPIQEIRPVASRALKKSTIDVDGNSIRVHAMPASLDTSPLIEGIDLAFFATPPSVTQAHAPVVAEEGIATIDIGGSLAGKVPMMVPGISLDPLQWFQETRLLSTPSAPALMVASVLSPLLGLGMTSCQGVVMLSAGLAGRDGVAELSQQVIALLQSQTPPRKVFPSGLAFDLMPSVGTPGDDWTGVERRIAVEVAGLLPIPPQRVVISTVMVPLFAGLGLSLFVDVSEDLEGVRNALSASSLLEVVDPIPGPRRLIGNPRIHVGRLRADPRGEGIHLWASADNLRACASVTAVQSAVAMWRDGLI